MDDLQSMFPVVDRKAIEKIFRDNNGDVQSTIDELLILHGGLMTNYQDSDTILTGGTFQGRGMRITWESNEHTQEKTSSLTGGEHVRSQPKLDANSRWKAPMVGPLPADFLRIGYSGNPRPVRDADMDILSVNNNFQRYSSPYSLVDEEDENVLAKEREKLASLKKKITLAQELRRSQEADSVVEQPSHEDVALKQKIKDMGKSLKSTKKNISKMAKRFSCGISNPGDQYLVRNPTDSKCNLIGRDEGGEDLDKEGSGQTVTKKRVEFDDVCSTNTAVSDRIGRLPSNRLPHNRLPGNPLYQDITDEGRRLRNVNNATDITNTHPSGDVRTERTEPIVFYVDDHEFEYKSE